MENNSYEPSSEGTSVVSFKIHREDDDEEINIFTVDKNKRNHKRIICFVIVLFLILSISIFIISRKRSHYKSSSEF